MSIDSATTVQLSVLQLTETPFASRRETLQENGFLALWEYLCNTPSNHARTPLEPQDIGSRHGNFQRADFSPSSSLMPALTFTAAQGANNPYLRYTSHTQQSIDLTTPIEETLNWLVAKGARIESPLDVRAYLRQYTDLSLHNATQFSLELYRDPEIDDSYLTLYVRRTSYEPGILDSIDEINLECELLLAGIRGWLITTTDFRMPR
jgi:hypothetical protein